MDKISIKHIRCDELNEELILLDAGKGYYKKFIKLFVGERDEKTFKINIRGYKITLFNSGYIELFN